MQWPAKLAHHARGARHTARWAAHNARIWAATRTKTRPPTRGGVAAGFVVWAVLVTPATGHWIAGHTAWLAYVLAAAVAAWFGLVLSGAALLAALWILAGRRPGGPA